MKKIYALAFAMLACAGTMLADEINLLQNAYSHSEGVVNSKDEFYGVWQCRYSDGREVEMSYLPDSRFNQVAMHESNNLPCYYLGQTTDDMSLEFIPAGNADVFTEGMPLMILVYPDESSFTDCSYSIPISVPESNIYTIEGCLANRKTIPGNKTGFLNTLNQMIFVGNTDPSVGLKNMEVIPGPTILVTNENNQRLPSAFQYAGAEQCVRFQKEITLDTEHKYLTIYAPANTYFLGDLKLIGDVSVSVIVDAVEMDDSNLQTELFDLSGRRVNPETAASGIYIQKKGTNAQKIMIR